MAESKTKDDVLSLCSKAEVDVATYKRFPDTFRWDLPAAVHPAPLPLPSQVPAAAKEATFPLAQLAANQSPTLIKEKNVSSLDKVFDRNSDGALRSLARLGRPSRTVWPVLCSVGGCGTTTVLATLGRALSILGESVLLVDAGGSPTLPLYFGGQTGEHGLLCFRSQGNRFEGAVHILQSYGEEDAPVSRAMAQLADDTHHVLLAPTTAMSVRMVDRLWIDGACLIVITPELRSLLAIEQILKRLPSPVRAHFLLNRVDVSNPLHAITRERLAAQLGDRLLPFVVPEASEISDALASGFTVIDTHPRSVAADSYFQLAEWLRAASAQRQM